MLAQSGNGYARTSGRIRDALASYTEVTGISPRNLHLSPIEELDLRDVTERQAGADGLCASRAPVHAWRAFLVNHFQRQALEVHFDAIHLKVS